MLSGLPTIDLKAKCNGWSSSYHVDHEEEDHSVGGLAKNWRT